MSTSFEATLERFRSRVSEAQRHLDALGLSGALDGLAREAASAEFRVTVLGRFKRGKSTVINALLGGPLLPAATLPCTSSVIEIRSGPTLTVHRWDGFRHVLSDWTTFLQAAGGAATNTGDSTYWSLQVPSPVLRQGIVLVDTPGTDEDPHRHAMASEQLRRTDAAVVLLDATQPAHLSDLSMLEDLHERVRLIVVGLNRADHIPVDEHQDVLDYARQRIRAAADIPGDRVLLLSGKASLAGDPWAQAQTELLRRTLSDVLLENTAGSKLAALAAKTDRALRDLEPTIAACVEKAEQQHRAARAAAARAHDLEGRGALLRRDARVALEARSQAAAREAAGAMRLLWPLVVQQTVRRKDRWESEYDPLFSPKLFATAIAEAAKADLVRQLEQGVKDKVQSVIEARLQQGRSEVMNLAHDLLEVGAMASHRDLDALTAELEGGALSEAFGSAVHRTSSTGSEAAVATVVSAIVGYIIADVILFYVMGAISGFLAPPLLIAAAVTGGVAYLIKGSDWVKSWVRSKIAETLEEELLKAQVVDQVGDGVASAAKDVFARTSKGYDDQFAKLTQRLGRDAVKLRQTLALAEAEARSRAKTAEQASEALARLRAELQPSAMQHRA